MQGRHAVFVSFYDELIPRTRLMARTFVDEGWRVSAIVWRCSPEERALSDNRDERFDYYTIDTSKNGLSLNKLASLPVFLVKARRAIARLGQVDLLVVTHFGLLPISWMTAARVRACLYDSPEFFCLDFREYFRVIGQWFPGLFARLERMLVGRMDRVLTVDSRDSWYRDYYARLGKQPLVIWNLPSILDDPDWEEVSLLDHDYEGKFVLMYVGAIKRAKGVFVLLSVAARLKDQLDNLLLVFVGSLQIPREEIDAFIDAKQLQGYVRFIMPCAYTTMLAHLRHAHLGMYFIEKGTRYDHVGAGGARKVFSYMQAGVPVIASRWSASCELLRQDEFGTCVDSGDASEVEKEILRYAQDRERILREGRRGRKLFEEKYNWEHEQEGLLKLVRGLS